MECGLAKVSEVGGGLLMEGFVWEVRKFECNPLLHRESVEVFQEKDDVESASWNEWAGKQQSSGCAGWILDDVP